MADKMDWPGLMRLGMGVLRLKPDEFWRLTPAELWLMSGRADPAPAMDRGRLEALAARFPDAGAAPTKGVSDA